MRLQYLIIISIISILLCSCSTYKNQNLKFNNNERIFKIEDFELISGNVGKHKDTEGMPAINFISQYQLPVKSALLPGIKETKKLRKANNYIGTGSIKNKPYQKIIQKTKDELPEKVISSNDVDDQPDPKVEPRKKSLSPIAAITTAFGIILIILSIMVPTSGWDVLFNFLLFVLGSFIVYLGLIIFVAAFIRYFLKPSQSYKRKVLSVLLFIFLGLLLAFLIYHLATYIFLLTLG